MVSGQGAPNFTAGVEWSLTRTNLCSGTSVLLTPTDTIAGPDLGLCLSPTQPQALSAEMELSPGS